MAFIAVRELALEEFSMMDNAISHYRIINELGEGVMGFVCQAATEGRHPETEAQPAPVPA